MEGGDREMGKWRTGMNDVSVYMDTCVKVWGNGRRGSWLLNFIYLACVSHFRTMCIGIILIVNLYPLSRSNTQVDRVTLWRKKINSEALLCNLITILTLMKVYNTIIPAKGCHIHAQNNITYLVCLSFVYMGGIVISCDSGVIK